MDSPRITYTPRPDTTPEAELSALTNVYRFVLETSRKKKGRPTTSGPGDGTKVKEDSADVPSLPH